MPPSNENARAADYILVTWDGPNDPDNPYNWPLRRKWTLTIMSGVITFLTMMNGTIITVAHDAISRDLHILDSSFPNSYWPVTSWAIGVGIFALFFLPLMEDFGVRWAFLGSYALFICFVIPQALAKDFATLVVTRFFAGGFVAIVGNTCVSVAGNIWEDERGRTIPVSIYIVAYLSGSSMGPVVGAAIFQFLSWRWVGYIQLIWFVALFPIYAIEFQESRGSTILRQRATLLRSQGKRAYTKHEIDSGGEDKSIVDQVLKSAVRPLTLFFREPVAFISTMWSAFTVGVLYIFTQSVEQVFSGLYDWTPCQGGYVQSAIVIGEMFGWAGTLLSARIYFASACRNTVNPGSPIPEARLYLAMLCGALGISGGMFVYAWTSFSFLPWIAPAVGLAMVGAGSMVVVTGITDYAVDSYSNYAGSINAIIVMGENTLAGILPLATQSLYSNMGYQWASTILGIIALAFSIVPIFVLIWGRKIRAKSPFMRELNVQEMTVSSN